MTTAQLIQRRITAQQALEVIEYGLRADKALTERRLYHRGALTGTERTALTAQREAALAVIEVPAEQFRFYALKAKRELRGELTAVKTELKAAGTTRQLRLQLAAAA